MNRNHGQRPSPFRALPLSIYEVHYLWGRKPLLLPISFSISTANHHRTKKLTDNPGKEADGSHNQWCHYQRAYCSSKHGDGDMVVFLALVLPGAIRRRSAEYPCVAVAVYLASAVSLNHHQPPPEWDEFLTAASTFRISSKASEKVILGYPSKCLLSLQSLAPRDHIDILPFQRKTMLLALVRLWPSRCLLLPQLCTLPWAADHRVSLSRGKPPTPHTASIDTHFHLSPNTARIT